MWKLDVLPHRNRVLWSVYSAYLIYQRWSSFLTSNLFILSFMHEEVKNKNHPYVSDLRNRLKIKESVWGTFSGFQISIFSSNIFAKYCFSTNNIIKMFFCFFLGSLG